MSEYQELSLRGKVFEQIKENILSGVYKENQELREGNIGKELGVSRTPVREALRQLELEGLVHIVPNKGAYVRGISSQDVKDIYLIRSYLEGLCARWATEHITDKQIEEMEEILLLSEFHLQKKGEQSNQVSKLDEEFHKILYRASNSRILEHVLSDFHKYVKLARTTSVSKENRAKESITEHKEILQAMKEKNADRAEFLANQHVMHVMENLKIE